MTNSVYITTTGPRCGKSLVALGLTELILRRTSKIGIFRPFIERPDPGSRDKNIDLLLSHFKLNLDYEDTYAYIEEDAADLLGQGRFDDVLDHIIQKYKALEAKCDFILCIGSDIEGQEVAFEVDINAQVAKNLGCPVLIVSRGDQRTPAEVQNGLRVTIDSFREMGCHILGAIINRVPEEHVESLHAAIQENLNSQGDLVLSVLPSEPVLARPSIAEIVEHLGAKVLYGENMLDRLADRYLVIAMQVDNFLPYLSPNALLITPGDRGDVLGAALLAHRSANYPRISGIVLTGGITPGPNLALLIDGIRDIVPILLVENDTYQTAAHIGTVRSYISAENAAKIAISKTLFFDYMDTSQLEAQLASIETEGVTPKMFTFNLIQQATADQKHIVLPEGNDERILRAAEVLLNRDIVRLTILGDPAEIDRSIHRLGLHIKPEQIKIMNPPNSPDRTRYAEKLVELRRHKGMNLDMAMDLMSDVSYYGTMMVYLGEADGMVSGAAHTTAHTIRPALQFVKTKAGFSVVSSVFFMCLENRVVVYGDCAINPNPNAEQLAEIAISSADTAQAFGIEPRLAMLSYSTGSSGEGEDVQRVLQATKLAQSRRPDLILEGPMQYDAAVSPDVAQRKMPGSRVAGRASVLIFPDLNTGNNTYKAVQRETGAIAIGPVLQGLKKPVNDLSRGCTVEDIINTVTITAIQAQQK
jgi:phosphate acetyltransferase